MGSAHPYSGAIGVPAGMGVNLVAAHPLHTLVPETRSCSIFLPTVTKRERFSPVPRTYHGEARLCVSAQMTVRYRLLSLHVSAQQTTVWDKDRKRTTVQHQCATRAQLAVLRSVPTVKKPSFGTIRKFVEISILAFSNITNQAAGENVHPPATR